MGVVVVGDAGVSAGALNNVAVRSVYCFFAAMFLSF